jgi:benzoyl-CoA reductase/2-hydroxyglutaryl-CoA dehydratase subunit BcrC/BadD/HgdB
MATIGFTSTIPVEVIFASGNIPLDLNNIFVSSENPSQLVAKAKMDGFPDTTCAWICGLYGTALSYDVDSIIGVTGGDCSETLALMEILRLRGKSIIPFSYPHDRVETNLRAEIIKLCAHLGTTIEDAEKIKQQTDVIRRRVRHLDELLWKENRATGNEVRLIELSCTDFEGDIERFAKKVETLITEVSARKQKTDTIRIGVCGVPPIISDLYSHLEIDGCRVVFSEVERQFSIPYDGDLAQSYSKYTYPYGIFARIPDIKQAIDERRIDGIIHYVQSFCFRGIEDIALKESLPVPVLTLQGDLPTRVTETMGIRIEAFLDMLTRRKERKSRSQ